MADDDGWDGIYLQLSESSSPGWISVYATTSIASAVGEKRVKQLVAVSRMSVLVVVYLHSLCSSGMHSLGPACMIDSLLSVWFACQSPAADGRREKSDSNILLYLERGQND